MNFKFVYKICTKNELIEAKQKGKFIGSKKDLEDGYIHFSDKEQVRDTLKKYFYKKKDLVLLKIDTSNLESMVWEQASDGNMFPHLYSTFDVSNIDGEYYIDLNEDGSFVLPSNF